MFINLIRDKVVDFHWNASDPWTIVSVSDDCETTGGGGTLQVTFKILSVSNFIKRKMFFILSSMADMADE